MADKKQVTVDEYIASFPEGSQVILTKVRQTIKAVMPADAAETISYGIPTCKVQGKPVVYFSGWKDHISLHPVPKDQALQKEIASYITGKGTIRFNLDKPIPYELVERVARQHLQERLG